MNTQAKHTPGPWLRGYSNHHHSHDIYAGNANGFTHVAFVNTGHADDADKSEADGRLIAAAPELLEALQALPDLHCMCDVQNPCWNNRATDVFGRHWGGGKACATCNARAAIARATGSA